MTRTKDPLSGFVSNKCFSAYSKDKQPYKEKSKSKDKKKDYSDARRRKRGEE